MIILFLLTTLYTPPKPYYNGLLINSFLKEQVFRYQGWATAIVPESTDVLNIGHSSFYWDTGYIRHIKGTTDTALYTAISGDNYWTRSGNKLYVKNGGDSVGIGIGSPTRKLDVNGSIRARGTSIIAGNSCEMYGSYVNGLNFYKPGFVYVPDPTLYFMFSADSLQHDYRRSNAQLRVYGKPTDTTQATIDATYIYMWHDSLNGQIGTEKGDLILSPNSGDVVYTTNHYGRLGTPSKYWQAMYVDTIFIGDGFYFNGIMIDSLTIGTADSLIWWSGSDSWGIKKRI
jgi:hypothetical protein